MELKGLLSADCGVQIQAPSDPPAARSRGARWRRDTLSALLVAAAAGAGVAVGPGLVDLVFPPDPYAQIDAEFGEQLLDLPGFEERFGDLQDAGDAFDAGAELAERAIGRVGDATLVEWAELMAEVLRSVEVGPCAAIARGNAPTDLAVRDIDLETYRRLSEITFEMARLELMDAPHRAAPSPTELETARAAFLEELGPARAQELAKTDLAVADDAEACAAIRDIFESINNIDGPARIHLLRDVGESLTA